MKEGNMATTSTSTEAMIDQVDPKVEEKKKELLKQLVDSGVHLGHKTSNWNPKMKEYIFGQRNGVYIIDLAQTVERLFEAAAFLRKQAKLGKNVLFVGTTKQATGVITEEAERAGIYYINQRWLGGLITNFDTIRASLGKLRDLEQQRDGGGFQGLGKKEISRLNREISKLNKSLGGLKKMRGKPDILFVVDQRKDTIAIKEAKKQGLSIISIVDTNSDPSDITLPIPANDDSIRSIRIITKFLTDAIMEGKGL